MILAQSCKMENYYFQQVCTVGMDEQPASATVNNVCSTRCHRCGDRDTQWSVDVDDQDVQSDPSTGCFRYSIQISKDQALQPATVPKADTFSEHQSTFLARLPRAKWVQSKLSAGLPMTEVGDLHLGFLGLSRQQDFLYVVGTVRKGIEVDREGHGLYSITGRLEAI